MPIALEQFQASPMVLGIELWVFKRKGIMIEAAGMRGLNI